MGSHKDAVSQTALARAKATALETKLREAQEEITKLKSKIETLEKQETVQPPPSIPLGEVNRSTPPDIEPHEKTRTQIAELEAQIRQVSEDNRRLRIKNLDLSGLLAECRQKALLKSTTPELSELVPATNNEFDSEPPDTDTSILWRLNGQLITVPLPKTLSEMKPWIDSYLTDKVILTKKAQHAADQVIDYQNVALVYKALLLLGTRCEMLSQSNDRALKQYFDEKLKELRLECGSAITTVVLGKMKRPGQYTAEWNGKTYTMDMALKRGNSREPRRILRVYFTYDDAERKIIVGHLPTHLENSLS